MSSMNQWNGSKRLVTTLLAGLSLAGSSLAQLPVPELVALGRLGGSYGQTQQPLEGAAGANLANAKVFITDNESLEKVVPKDGQQQQFIPVRALNELGLSNSRNFLLTRQPWNVATNNESVATPADVLINQYYQDECPETGRNYYRFHSDRDQVLRIDGLAQSLDSRARLLLSVKSSNQVTLATSAASNERDASLQVKLLANQDYMIVVHDQLYRGGPEYRYAIFLHDSVDREVIRIPNPRSAMVRPPLVESPPIQHVESVESTSKAMEISWPSRVVGDFHSNDDLDAFQLMCEQDVDIVAETISQRVGEITDCALALYRIDNAGMANEQSVLVAENDDMPGTGNPELRFQIKDALLRFHVPQKGQYRLVVRNQQRQSFPENPSESNFKSPAYTLEIRTPKPGFTLAAHWSSAVRDLEQARVSTGSIPAGGVATLSVHALRFDGFDKGIEIATEGVPADVQGTAAVIADNQNFARLNLVQNGTLSAQSVHRLQVVGSAAEMRSVALPVEFVLHSIDTFRASTSRVTDSLPLLVSEARLCPLTVELGAPGSALVEAIRGTPCKVPLRVTRRAGGEAAPVLFRLHQAPLKVTAAEIKIEPNINEGVIELQIPKDAPLGEAMVSGLCETTVSFPNPDPNAAEKTLSRVIQLPTSSIRLRIGDAP